MLMNICLMRSRPSLFLSRQLHLKRPVPVPRYPMTSLDGIPLTRTRAQTAIRACTTCALDGWGISRKKKYNIWCRCHRRTSVLRSLLRQRLDLPVLPLNAHTSCLFVHTHTWAVVRPLAAVPHLALALVSRDDHEHEHTRLDAGIR